MRRSLHEKIHAAAEICEATDATHTEVARDVLEMTRDNHRQWRNRELMPEGE